MKPVYEYKHEVKRKQRNIQKDSITAERYARQLNNEGYNNQEINYLLTGKK